MDQIFRYEVLNLLDTGEPFDSLVFITADRKRGTGGVRKELKGWAKIKADTPVELLPGEFRRKVDVVKRNPDHYQHKTINLFNPNNPGAHATKVHWRLITFFNGKRVIS